MQKETSPILVVDDEKQLADSIVQRLQHEGYKVEVAYDGLEAYNLALKTNPILIILDVMLPGMDGVELTLKLKNKMYVPILMLTARDDENDVLLGLNAGADGYMKKPFSMRELIVRVKALLRTVKDAKKQEEQGTQNVVISFADVEIYVDQRKVYKNKEQVHLTATEFDILMFLLKRKDNVVSRNDLLKYLWGWSDASGTRTVDSHMKSLRKKIGADFFRTVHGVGYAFDAKGKVKVKELDQA